MSSYYNQNYSEEQINSILRIIIECVKQCDYVISKNENRKENIEFIYNYNLSSAKQKKLLLSIKTNDFCHSLQNTNKGYENEILYVFCPQVKLFNFDGIEENLDIYTKFNIIKRASGNFVVTISLHKRNKPLTYLFR